MTVSAAVVAAVLGASFAGRAAATDVAETHRGTAGTGRVPVVVSAPLSPPSLDASAALKAVPAAPGAVANALPGGVLPALPPSAVGAAVPVLAAEAAPAAAVDGEVDPAGVSDPAVAAGPGAVLGESAPRGPAIEQAVAWLGESGRTGRDLDAWRRVSGSWDPKRPPQLSSARADEVSAFLDTAVGLQAITALAAQERLSDEVFQRVFERILAGAHTLGGGLAKHVSTPARRAFLAELYRRGGRGRGAVAALMSEASADAAEASEFLSAIHPEHRQVWRDAVPARDGSYEDDNFALKRLRSFLRDETEALAFAANVESLRGTLPPESLARLLATSGRGRGDRFLPLAPKPPSFVAGGYELGYAVPGTQAAPKEGSARVVAVKRQRTSAREMKSLRDRFSRFDDLIQANFRALELMAAGAGGLDKTTAKAILEEAERMTAAYEALTGGSDDAKAVRASLDRLSRDLEGRWARLGARARLPGYVAARVTFLEVAADARGLDSLHSLINYVHQASFKALESSQADRPEGHGELLGENGTVRYWDVGEAPILDGGRLRSEPLAALAEELETIPGIGADTVIVKDEEAWVHAALGAHSAEVYANFADPDDGGMLRVRYMEWGTLRHNTLRLKYVEALLRGLGFSVEVEGGQYITAVLDKDHGLARSTALRRLFPLVLRAVHDTLDMNLELEGHLTKPVTEAVKSWWRRMWDRSSAPDDAEEREVTARSVEAYLGEGRWISPEDGNANRLLWTGPRYERYRSAQGARDALRAALNEELRRLGLPTIPAEEPFGQETIERLFNAPIRAALDRGELAPRDGLPQRVPYRPVDALAADAVRDELAAADLAAALNAGPEALAFEPIGAAGSLRAERAQARLPGGALTVYGLRDPESGQWGYARAEWTDGGGRRALGAAELAEKLGTRVPAERASAAVRAWFKARLRDPAASARGAFSARGLAAAEGTATARVTFDENGFAGRVLVVPFTTPDHLGAMRKSAAVVTTGGGGLSHAAITARELGKPSLILPTAVWRRTKDGPALEITTFEPEGSFANADGVVVTPGLRARTTVLREGDLVRVDGDSGELSLPSADGRFPAPAPRPEHRRPPPAPLGGADLAELEALAKRASTLTVEDLPRLRRALRRADRLPAPAQAREAVGRLRETEAALAAAKRRAAALRRPSVVPLGAVDDDDRDLVGGKLSKLGEILAVVRAHGGFVPEALGVTTEAYLRFLDEQGLTGPALKLAGTLDAALSAGGAGMDAAVETLSGRMRDLLLSRRLSPDSGLGREILDALKAHGLGGKRLAVRSSAVQEDQQDAAFAGAAESYLHVRPEEVLSKIVENWASFWLPRSVVYRHQHGIASADVRPSTILQAMAEGEASGVMFTRNPVDGADEVVIDAGYGLGEGVVSGLVQADRYVTGKEDGEESRPPFVADKRVAVVSKEDGSGTRTRSVPRALRRRRCLTPAQTRELSRLGVALEDHFGYPLDIEFAVQGGRIAILQARPVTSLRR